MEGERRKKVGRKVVEIKRYCYWGKPELSAKVQAEKAIGRLECDECGCSLLYIMDEERGYFECIHCGQPLLCYQDSTGLFELLPLMNAGWCEWKAKRKEAKGGQEICGLVERAVSL